MSYKNKVISYLDRQGYPITISEWGKLWEDPAYRFVRTAAIGDFLVKTLWLGMNHQLFFGKPEIFETRIFGPKDSPYWRYEIRYTTEDEAIEGHERTCLMIRGRHEVAKNDAAVLEFSNQT